MKFWFAGVSIVVFHPTKVIAPSAFPFAAATVSMVNVRSTKGAVIPSSRAWISTPGFSGGKDERKTISGFSSLIRVSCSVKSVSPPWKVSIATTSIPFSVRTSRTASSASMEKASAASYRVAALWYASFACVTSIPGGIRAPVVSEMRKRKSPSALSPRLEDVGLMATI